MSYHHVPLAVTDQIVTMMAANLANIKGALGSFEITDKDLTALPKMGPRRYVFHYEAFIIAKQFSNLLFHNRGFTSYDEVKSNYEKLAPIYSELCVLFKQFTVIMKVLGSNTLVHAFATYDAIRGTNNDGVPGIEHPRKTLGAFFKGQGVEEEPEEETDGPFIPGANGGPNSGGATDGGDGK